MQILGTKIEKSEYKNKAFFNIFQGANDQQNKKVCIYLNFFLHCNYIIKLWWGLDNPVLFIGAQSETSKFASNFPESKKSVKMYFCRSLSKVLK
ncbi:MAG: hypothetical protein S4CHLAM6_09260 [Chlamydiae bacterium]|nr:hypothetical protein [Chlamydiota bacterium]